MKSNARTVNDYLAELDDERREAIGSIRNTFLAHMDARLEEGMQYGMIGYYLPHSVYPSGYHVDPTEPLPFASIGSQKRHIGLYLFCVYTDPDVLAWFTEAWKATGKRLDMGKSCVRVKRLDDVPLTVLAELLERVTAERFMAAYEAAIPESRRRPRKS